MMKTKQNFFLLLLCWVVIFCSCKDDVTDPTDPVDSRSDSTLIAVSGVTIRPTDTLRLGDSVRLTATVLPENAGNKSLTWNSSNDSVAVVSANGLVAALGVGSATITVTTVDGGKTASCALTVLALPADSTAIPVDSVVFLNPSRISLEVGKTDTLCVSIFPASAQNKTVTWSSSDSMTVAVSSNGVITAASWARPGTVTITATVDGKSASCLVGVLPVMGVSVSSEAQVSGNEGGAAFLMDGNMDTYWHSQWTDSTARLPHRIQIDMGMNCYVKKAEMWRKGGNNNDIKTCTLQTSSDAITWDNVETYSYSVAEDKYRVHYFNVAPRARYVRYYITESNRPPYATIAEIRIDRAFIFDDY